MRKLIPCFIFLVVACKQKTVVPDEIIERPRMQELLWDLFRADAFITGYMGKGDSAFNYLKGSVTTYRQVLAVHKTNKEEFKKSLEWYQRHPKVMRVILDSLQKKQSRILEQRSRPANTFMPDSLKAQ